MDPRATDLLAESGIGLDAAVLERLEALVAAIRRFQPLFSLVSQRDLDHLWDRHVVDSLSLAPYAATGMRQGLVDIGSGGGFPGLVLAALFPAATVRLVERSAAKVGFLHNARAAMGLARVTIVEGNFPAAASLEGAGVVTARAVEKGGQVAGAVCAALPLGVGYLCQQAAGASVDPALFHVEHIEDGWTEAGLRRGALYRIQRRADPS